MENEEQMIARIKRIQRKFQERLPLKQKLKYLKYLRDVHISLDILKKTSIDKTIDLMQNEDGVEGKIAAQLIINWKQITISQPQCSSLDVSHQTLNNKIILDKNKLAGVSSVKHAGESNFSTSPLRQTREESSCYPHKPKIHAKDEKSKKLNNILSLKSIIYNVNDHKLKDKQYNTSLSIKTDATSTLSTVKPQKIDVRKNKIPESKMNNEEDAISDNSNVLDLKKMSTMPMFPMEKKHHESNESFACDDEVNRYFSKKKSKSCDELLLTHMLPMEKGKYETNFHNYSAKYNHIALVSHNESTICDNDPKTDVPTIPVPSREKKDYKTSEGFISLDQESSSNMDILFGKVVRKSHCTKRTCSSNIHNQVLLVKKQKKFEGELNSVASSEKPPRKKKQKEKKPLMLKAIKSLKKQKGVMGTNIT